MKREHVTHVTTSNPQKTKDAPTHFSQLVMRCQQQPL